VGGRVAVAAVRCEYKRRIVEEVPASEPPRRCRRCGCTIHARLRVRTRIPIQRPIPNIPGEVRLAPPSIAPGGFRSDVLRCRTGPAAEHRIAVVRSRTSPGIRPLFASTGRCKIPLRLRAWRWRAVVGNQAILACGVRIRKVRGRRSICLDRFWRHTRASSPSRRTMRGHAASLTRGDVFEARTGFDSPTCPERAQRGAREPERSHATRAE
jgi:hypothetical protein